METMKARTLTDNLWGYGVIQRTVPAGTIVRFDPDKVHPSGWVGVTVVGNPRMQLFLRTSEIEVV